MLTSRTTKSLLGGALAACALLAGMPDAEARVKFRFTPPFGTPFADLEWAGEAIIDTGSCTAIGSVSNFGPDCAGQLSFEDVTLTLSSLTTPAISQTLNPIGGLVISVQRTGLAPEDFQSVVGTPFNPISFPAVPSATYQGNPAYFSLVMLGGTDVQLYWFKENPGTFFQNPDVYTACGKPGINVIVGNECGQSSNTAVGVFLPVPEPSTYAMMFAGLGALGLIARRRSRRA